MAKDLTILYLTDNTLPEKLDVRVRELLVKAAGEYPIVSVSQKSINLGNNICVGDIGRSWLSIYKQLQAGLAFIETPYVATVEHDCLYTPDHFEFRPPDDRFWYNANHWLLDYWGEKAEGMFSEWPRRIAMSQLIVRRERLDLHVKYTIPGLEQAIAEGRRRRQIYPLLSLATEVAAHERFRSQRPNIDVRHGGNFTGPRRGKHRCYSLPDWGTLQDIFPAGR